MRNTFHKPGLVALGVLLLGSMTAACTLMKPSYDDLAGGDDPALPDASNDVSQPETSVDAQPEATPDDSAPDAADDAIDEDVADGPSDVVNEPDAPLTCESDEKVCSNACVKTDDPGYGCAPVSCSPCAVPAASAACSLGVCVIETCNANRLDCNESPQDGCEIDALNDPDHCGVCGNACTAPPNMVSDCTAGLCEAPVCVTGFGDCDSLPGGDAGTDAGYDAGDAADSEAGDAADSEAGDAADSEVGSPVGNGCETPLLQDPNNCGACGKVCPPAANATPECSAGTCVLQCAFGFDDCDGDPANGCEAELSSDPSNCGLCGKTCSYPHAAGVCASSMCHIGDCSPMWGNCNMMSFDGCEADLSTDKTNCGACYNMCSPGQKCLSGVCG